MNTLTLVAVLVLLFGDRGCRSQIAETQDIPDATQLLDSGSVASAGAKALEKKVEAKVAQEASSLVGTDAKAVAEKAELEAAKKEQALVETKAKVEERKVELKAAQAEHALLEKEIEAEKAKIETKKEMKAKLKEEVDDTSDEIDDGKYIVKQKSKKVLDDDSEELKDKIEDVKMRKENLERKQRRIEAEIREAEEEIRRLEQEREATLVSLRLAEDKRNPDLEYKLREVQREIDGARSKLDDIERRERDMKERLERLKSEKDFKTVVVDDNRSRYGDSGEIQQACLNQNEFLRQLKSDVDEYKRRKNFCDFDNHQQTVVVTDPPVSCVPNRPGVQTFAEAPRDPIHVIVETVNESPSEQAVPRRRKVSGKGQRRKMTPLGLDPVMDEYQSKQSRRKVKCPNAAKEKVVLNTIPRTMNKVCADIDGLKHQLGC